MRYTPSRDAAPGKPLQRISLCKRSVFFRLSLATSVPMWGVVLNLNLHEISAADAMLGVVFRGTCLREQAPNA